MDIILIIFLLAALAVGIFAAEQDSFVFTTATVVATFAALDLFFGVPVWATIVANPLTLVLFAFAYVAIGSAYTAIWRWPEFLSDKADNMKHSFAEYLKSHPGKSVDDFMNSHHYNKYSAGGNVGYLANWVLAWPLSLLWELARKPAIWVWDTTYELLGNLFERIGKRITKNILGK